MLLLICPYLSSYFLKLVIYHKILNYYLNHACNHYINNNWAPIIVSRAKKVLHKTLYTVYLMVSHFFPFLIVGFLSFHKLTKKSRSKKHYLITILKIKMLFILYFLS